MPKAKSRPARWSAAVTEAKAALAKMQEAYSDLDNAVSELRSLSEEYQEWQGNLPENLQGSALNDKLEEATTFTDLDTQSIEDAMSELEGELDNAEGIELPRGFGKD